MSKSSLPIKRRGASWGLAASGAVALGAGLLAVVQPAAAQGTMYACQSSREFYSINLDTGAKTFRFNITSNATVSAALAYDCETQTTYVTNTLANVGVSKSLYRLNLTNGQATLVGPFGDPAILMHGLEINSITGDLYGISSHNGGLYAVDRDNGAATLIGLTGIIGLGSFGNLGFNSDTGVMYATNALTDSLYRINLTTGAATLVGPLNGPISIGALAYNIDNHTMYMVDNDNDILYQIDLTTGQAEAIGPTGPGNLIGLVYVTPTCGSACPLLTGDLNCDCVVSVGDISPFVLALTMPAQYAIDFPACHIENADVNLDGVVSVGDIAGFVSLLTGG